MPRIRVATDSTCDIPEGLLKQADIAVVPMRTGLDAEALSDPTGIAPDRLVRYLRHDPGAQPAAQAPDIDELTRFYRGLRDTCDGIISIHNSSKLSDTYANAMAAREVFGPMGQGGPFPIAVVDSLSMGMGLGWLTLAVAAAARTGEDLQRLVGRAHRLVEQTHVAFYADRLDALYRAGRVPRLASQWESIAAMRPLYNLDEGQVVVYEKTRTRAKARDALYNFVEDFPKIGEIAVFHIGAYNDVEHLMTRIGAIYPRERVLIIEPGEAVASWLGPEAVGVAVIEGEE